LTVKQLYGILIPLAFMIMEIAFGFPTPLHIEIQPVIVHSLKFSLTAISKRGSYHLFFVSSYWLLVLPSTNHHNRLSKMVLNPNIIKTDFMIVFLVFFSPLFLSVSIASNVVTVTGTGALSSSSAKKDALRAAFRNAVEQAVGVQVASQTSVKNFKVIEDKIYTVSEGFVEKWEVISEQVQGPDLILQIKAWVIEGKLNKALFLNGIDVKQVYDWVGNPRVIVALQESIDNQDSPIKIAQPELEKALKGRGISVYSGSQVKSISQKDLELLMSNPDFAKVLGSRVGAEIVVAGKSLSQHSRTLKIGNYNQHFYTAYLQIQAYNTATGEVLHSSHYKSSDRKDLSAIGKFDAAMNAIRNCIDDATPDILHKIVATWYDIQHTPSTFIVLIENVNYDQVRKIKNKLFSFNNTRDVQLRKFSNSIAEIEIKYEGMKDQFINSILKSGMPVKVISEEQNKLFLRGL